MRARWVPAVVALCLAVTACGGDDDDPPPATLPPVSPTATPSPTVVAVPTEATPATPEGAAEFARFFVNEVYAAYRTKDPDSVRNLSSPSCETCRDYISTVEALRDQDARLSDTYTVEVVDAVAPKEEPGASTTSVTVILRVGEFVVMDPAGKVLAREEADAQAVQTIDLERRDNGWLVSEVTVE